MRYLSVCSGIEAATVAWHRNGWNPVGFSEIEAFPSAVLSHHFPNVRNFGDMTNYERWPIERGAVDVLVGGTPCQSFSVAGLRKGLSDPRGGLMLTYLGIAERLRPRWVVWENVPGVLSSNGGRDFGAFLGALGELGYGWAFRVLDAQWVRTHGHPHAVAQRRRRVFVVANFGNGTAAATVLFGRESVCRDSAALRTSRKKFAADAVRRIAGNGKSRLADALQLTCGNYSMADKFDTALHPVGAVQGNIIGRNAGGPQGIGVSMNGEMFTLTKTDVHAVAFTIGNLARGAGPSPSTDVFPTLINSNGRGTSDQWPSVMTTTPSLAQFMTVRRLSPRECERLQGFPDDWTRIPWRGKSAEDCPDGPRYKAIGNSMAVNCMEWIGNRIHEYEMGAANAD